MNPTTIFELVKIVLDQLYEAARRMHGKNVDQMIASRLASPMYANLSSPYRAPVDYTDPISRFAFIFNHAASHADYVVQLLELMKERKRPNDPLFDDAVLRLSCLGGGPGSELIGIVKFLTERRPVEKARKVLTYMLDKEQGWAEALQAFDAALDSPELALETCFEHLDVTNAESWLQRSSFVKADLFTLSYFVSEVKSLDCDGSVGRFWEFLFKSSRPGACFLYIDMSGPEYAPYFDECCKGYLQTMLRIDEARITPRHQEQSTAIDIYSQKFERSPKIQSWISCRLYVKP